MNPARRPSPLNIYGIAMILGALAGGAAAFMGATGNLPVLTGPLAAALGLGGLLVLGALSIVYWRRLDETAREAHKWAWFWGGGAGLFLALALMPMLLVEGAAAVVMGEFAGAANGPVVTGVMIVFCFQSVGYGIAWVCWWLNNHRS
jgi:hypothetical protein